MSTRTLEDVERDLRAARAKLQRSPSTSEYDIELEQRLTDEHTDMKNTADECYEIGCHQPLSDCRRHPVEGYDTYEGSA